MFLKWQGGEEMFENILEQQKKGFETQLLSAILVQQWARIWNHRYYSRAL
jgi:hypothetical protein